MVRQALLSFTLIGLINCVPTTSSATPIPVPTSANPTILDFNPYVYFKLAGEGITFTSEIISQSSSSSSSGAGVASAGVNLPPTVSDGQAFINAFASADLYGAGSANSTVDFEVLLTVTNTSSVDGFFTISYGYGVFGNVDNEGGFTHDAWTVGNVDTTFNLIPQGVETQDHQCVGGQFGSECQNFYDFNDYNAFSYEIPAGQVNTVDMLINLRLSATTVNEPTPWVLIASVFLLFGAINTRRVGSRGAP